MKISKFNENDQDKLNDFVELLVSKFFGNDVGNMGDYNFTNLHALGVFRLSFEFMAIEEDELLILQKISKYIKKFDISSKLIIEANMIDKELNVVDAYFHISTISYPKINDDLEMWQNTKIYNL